MMQSIVFYADAECKGIVEKTQPGEIKSPGNYDQEEYDNSAYCQWRITAPFGHVRIVR